MAKFNVLKNAHSKKISYDIAGKTLYNMLAHPAIATLCSLAQYLLNVRRTMLWIKIPLSLLHQLMDRRPKEQRLRVFRVG